jgi:hypothetical protein
VFVVFFEEGVEEGVEEVVEEDVEEEGMGVEMVFGIGGCTVDFGGNEETVGGDEDDDEGDG